MKLKPCKYCGKEGHTAFACYKKPTTKIRKESEKAMNKRLTTREAWFEANPPDKDGFWECYIPKHPDCPRYLTKKTLQLEHDLSKARRPDLQYDITNIFPACRYDNKVKSSLSAEEYMTMRKIVKVLKTEKLKSKDGNIFYLSSVHLDFPENDSKHEEVFTGANSRKPRTNDNCEWWFDDQWNKPKFKLKEDK